MPQPPLSARDSATQKPGKEGVTYPYGDLRFPRIIEAYNATKTGVRRERAFLSAHPDKLAFPGALLVSQQSDKGSDVDTNIIATYETLPGPVFVDVSSYRDTGIPMITARREVAINAPYTTGEFQPTAINVSSIVTNGDGTCTVTLASAHDLPPKCWVKFSGTNSTPAIDGNLMIISVPAETQMIVSGTLSGAGTAAGTMQAINKIVRELKPVPNNAAVQMKIDTMVGVASVTTIATRNVSAITDNGSGTALVVLTANHGLIAGQWVTFAGTGSTPKIDGPRKILSTPTSAQVTVLMTITGSGGAAGTMAPMGDLANYNEDFRCWKDFDFPDFLKAINFYNDIAFTGGAPGYNSHSSYGGTVGLPMQDGYRGPCRARRLRLFFVGAPPDSFEENLKPTFIMPSSGTLVIKGGSITTIFAPSNDATTSFSTSFHTGRVPHCLTGLSPSVTTVIDTGGSVNISSIGTGATPLVTTSTAHGFTVGQYVRIIGSNSTPPLDGIYSIAGVPLTTTFNVIPPASITGAGTAAGTVSLSGATTGGGQASCILDLPESVPPFFTVGDIITLMGQPTKYDAGALWEVIVYFIYVPYTSGSPPP